jgi:hypothetical protein
MKPRSIELHIEELVLDGFPPADRYRIAEAIEGELARLLTEQGFPGQMQSGDINRLDGGTFDIAQGERADAIGSQIAQHIHGGLTVEQ